MEVGPIEVYRPRAVSDLGIWTVGNLQLKVYGLVAGSRSVNDDMQSIARTFVETQVLERVTAMGECNGMGFVVIHPGELGLTISAHWWVQGSVLCQHNYRKLYDADEAMDTVTRPVVACVWELDLINAEQEAWRKTMMTGSPDPAAYLDARPCGQTT